MTHYDVLGVPTDAPVEDVRRAYLRLARAHHPDVLAAASPVARADSDRRMRAINAAWTVLGDAGRRRAYDRSLGLPDEARVAASRDGLSFERGAWAADRVDDLAEEVDPLLVPDEPYATPRRSGTRRAATVAPVVFFASSLGMFALGLFMGSVGLITAGVVLFALSCMLVVVVPLLYLTDARRHDR